MALTGGFADDGLSLGDMIRLQRIHYGDPPNVRCCDAGPTMNSVMKTVLEYWSCQDTKHWTRDLAREGPVGEDWRDPVDAVPEVLAAVDGGAATVRVTCSSRQSQYALLRRLVAAAARSHSGRSP